MKNRTTGTKEELSERSAELHKLIRIAAAHVNSRGSVKGLCEKAKIGYPAVLKAIRRGHFTVGQALALEAAAGAHLLPKEKLCPKFAE